MNIYLTIGYAMCMIIVISSQNEKELTTVVPTNPTVIFTPNGKVVNQFSYANIRLHVNITTLFEETRELCRVSKMLEEETSKINPDTKTRKLIHILTEDLVISCKNNVLKLNEINKTFGFKVENLSH